MVEAYNILITGSNGQLGNCIRFFSGLYKSYNFYFTDRHDLDITETDKIVQYVDNNKINIIINCAAYTNVDYSEKNKNLADLINHISVENLAKICAKKNIQLIHISTDYVFDGKNENSYKENDKTNPINYYGISKLNGENKMMQQVLFRSIIIRTSWLYSSSSNNFVKKIINKINSHDEFSIYGDETGSPTNAKDLAKTILDIIPKIKNSLTEIYHFSNTGICSRYEFAKKINMIINGKSKIQYKLNPEVKVKRPRYSVLDTRKISKKFNLNIRKWEESLADYLNDEILKKINNTNAI